jgi:hypothetical protein
MGDLWMLMNAPAQGAFAEEFVELVLRYAVRSQGRSYPYAVRSREVKGLSCRIGICTERGAEQRNALPTSRRNLC